MKLTILFIIYALIMTGGRTLPVQTTPVYPPEGIEVTEHVIVHNPAVEIEVWRYREQHPSQALIYTNESYQGDTLKGMLLYEGPAKEIALLHGKLNGLGDRAYYNVMPDDWMEQLGISLEPREDTEHTYEFIRDIGSSDSLEGFCNPVRLCGFEGEEQARVYGSLLSLYGRPDYESEDMEDMYQYRLIVTRDDGRQAVLLVYSGPTGASVSTVAKDEDIKEGAAFALKQLIDQTPPADYSYQGYYWDGPVKIECGSKDHVPYYREEELSIEEIYNYWAQ